MKALALFSGGLDSAIVAVLLKEAFNENMKGILMPSHFSSQNSIDDAKELCEKFNIDYEIVEVENMIKGYFSDNFFILLTDVVGR